MSTQLQLRRDTAAALGAVNPVEGEPGYDKTNKRLIVGDGTTAGGLPVTMAADFQKQSFGYAVATDDNSPADGNAISIALAPAAAAYVDGLRVTWRQPTTNTSSVDIDVNGLGAKNLLNDQGAELAASKLRADGIYTAVYNGSTGDFRLADGPVGPTGPTGPAGPPGPPGPGGSPGCACFLGDTPVLMADGSVKRLEDVKVGELVADHFGGASKVLGIRLAWVAGNTLYRINGSLVTTAEHSFLTPEGDWVACDPGVVNWGRRQVENTWRSCITTPDGQVEMWQLPGARRFRAGQLERGTQLLYGDRAVAVRSLERVSLPPTDRLYTLITTRSFIIEGGFVVDGWGGDDWDKPQRDDVDRTLQGLRHGWHTVEDRREWT